MKPAWRRWAARVAIALALAAVFSAYLGPHVAVDLANMLWTCL